MKPDFLIGGAPKCATTTIFDYLAYHPSICASDRKEPHYFASAALGRPIMKGRMDWEEYQGLIAKCRPDQLAGEGSTHYLHHAAAVAPLLAETVPKAKLIFCLRNPVERAYSHFLFRYAVAGPYTLGGVGQSRDFASFVADPEMFSMGDYATNLAIFRDHFPEQQIHLVFFEDIRRDLAGVLRGICDFLEVSADHPFDLSRRSNKTVYPVHVSLTRRVDALVTRIYPLLSVPGRRRMLRWRRRLLFSNEAAKPRLSGEERRFALDLYRPSIERLESMTARDLSGWRAA